MESAGEPARGRRTPPALIVLSGFLGVVLLGAMVATRLFVIEAFQIPSEAMAPALLVGDHFFVSKWPQPIHRGDVVVFEYPLDRSTTYIKRVIAIAGDTIGFSGHDVVLNGESLSHQRTISGCPEGVKLSVGCEIWEETLDGRRFEVMYETSRLGFNLDPIRVPPGAVFVMGDNRDNSSDSRVWGPLRTDLVKGQGLVIWWSWGEKGVRWNRLGRSVR